MRKKFSTRIISCKKKKKKKKKKLCELSNCSPGASPLGARIREEDKEVLDAQRDPIEERFLDREQTARRTKETWLWGESVCGGGTETRAKDSETLWRLFSHLSLCFFLSLLSLPSLACRCLSTSLEMLGQAAARYVNIAIEPSLTRTRRRARVNPPPKRRHLSKGGAVGGAVVFFFFFSS